MERQTTCTAHGDQHVAIQHSNGIHTDCDREVCEWWVNHGWKFRTGRAQDFAAAYPWPKDIAPVGNSGRPE